jgi:hypothetical protein
VRLENGKQGPWHARAVFFGKCGASIAAFRFRKLSFKPEAHQPLAELLSLAPEKEERADKLSNLGTTGLFSDFHRSLPEYERLKLLLMIGKSGTILFKTASFRARQL